MVDIRIARLGIDSVDGQVLIEALNAELAQRYPEPGANRFRLDADEVSAGRGAFLVAYVEGVAVGCGAVRRLDDSEAEVKRMYVTPSMRNQGVGGALLDALEAVARELGVSRLVLETGQRQPEAIALYTHAGFEVIPPFGEYFDSPFSVCMAKELS